MWAAQTTASGEPLYLAVVDALERDIRLGVLQGGDRLPTHRKLAEISGIALGTATRIYREAESRGLVTGVVGRGTFVAVDACKKPALVHVGQNVPCLDMSVARPLCKMDPHLGAIAKKAAHKSRQSTLMAYSDAQGMHEHRKIGGNWISRFGLNVPPENIVITAGAQHALFLICNCLFNPGDRIAAERLTFPGIKAAAQRNGIRLEAVDMDEEGMLPGELDALCNRQHISGVYISGRLQNPTNGKMSPARCRALREIIRRHKLLLVENDSYGFLSDDPHASLSSQLPDQSVYVSSLSKVFLAGLRIAFVAAPSRHVTELTQGIVDSMFCVSPLCAEIATECIAGGHADESIQKKRRLVAKRVALFRKIFSGHSFVCSDQGMFAWLTLPDPLKAHELESDALSQNMRLLCAEHFAIGSIPAPEAVRISLTGVEELDLLRKALRNLERLVAAHS